MKEPLPASTAVLTQVLNRAQCEGIPSTPAGTASHILEDSYCHPQALQIVGRRHQFVLWIFWLVHATNGSMADFYYPRHKTSKRDVTSGIHSHDHPLNVPILGLNGHYGDFIRLEYWCQHPSTGLDPLTHNLTRGY